MTRLDQLNELLRPGRALPPNQSVGVVKGSSKGWGGLQNLAQHKDNWCEGYRQIYFSTFATFYKDFNTVHAQCAGAVSQVPKAFEVIKSLAVICSNLQRDWKNFYGPGSPGPLPPVPPISTPPTMPTMPPTMPPVTMPPPTMPAVPPATPPAMPRPPGG